MIHKHEIYSFDHIATFYYFRSHAYRGHRKTRALAQGFFYRDLGW